MKPIQIMVIAVCFILGTQMMAFGKSNTTVKQQKVRPAIQKSSKGAVAIPGSFRVKKVIFKKLNINNSDRLVTAVLFNRSIDASSVKPNLNIRLLKKNSQHFWVDASTQNNIVRVRPDFITWVSGAPLSNGYYIMHLRGTIKSKDGTLLDCNGDGKGEGGNLPPYESQIFQVDVTELEEILSDRLEDIIRNP